jgi:hypothetical protein
MAAKPRRRNRVVQLRGWQRSFRYRFLAEAWRWYIAIPQLLLKRLETDLPIVPRTVQDGECRGRHLFLPRRTAKVALLSIAYFPFILKKHRFRQGMPQMPEVSVSRLRGGNLFGNRQLTFRPKRDLDNSCGIP